MSLPAAVCRIPGAFPFQRKYILFNGPQWPEIGEIRMFATSHSTSRLAAFTFAVLMAVAINGGMLMKFDNVATAATLAQSTQAPRVAVLETVTIVGQRI